MKPKYWIDYTLNTKAQTTKTPKICRISSKRRKYPKVTTEHTHLCMLSCFQNKSLSVYNICICFSKDTFTTLICFYLALRKCSKFMQCFINLATLKIDPSFNQGNRRLYTDLNQLWVKPQENYQCSKQPSSVVHAQRVNHEHLQNRQRYSKRTQDQPQLWFCFLQVC